MSRPLERVSNLARGIRPRVVFAYIGLMLVGLLVANLVVRQVLIGRLDATIEAALTQEVEEFRRLAEGVDPATGEPFGDDVEALFDTFLRRNVPDDNEAFYTVVDGRPFLTSFSPPAALLGEPGVLERVAQATEPDRFDVETSGAGQARVLVTPLSIETDSGEEVLGAFVVAFFPADERAEIDQAVVLVALVSLGVLALTSFVAWSLAGRVLRPVRTLTETATSITESDISARIPVEGDDELARLGHTVNAMLDRLEASAVAQRRFLDDIAHDLRTPITIVRGHLEVLDDDPDERAAALALVDDELDRMSRYVNDLLLLAKAEQADFLHLGLVDVGEWASDVGANAKRLDARSVVLGDAPAPGVAFGEFDADRLTQAVLNLVVNALQHSAADDTVVVAVRVLRGDLEIAVVDRGQGIDPARLDQLFERSARGDRSRIDRREGTGLGLAIVRAIADAHGGTVTATSEPGVGSTFTLTVPLDPAGRVGLADEPAPDDELEATHPPDRDEDPCPAS